MNDVRQLINSRERSLKIRLNFLHTELKKAQTGSLKVLVPEYEGVVSDEIRFILLQLNKIKASRKSTLLVVK